MKVSTMKFEMPKNLSPTVHDTRFSNATGSIAGVPQQLTSDILALITNPPGTTGETASWRYRKVTAGAGTRNTSMEVHGDDEKK
jgi:hypothetical protein